MDEESHRNLVRLLKDRPLLPDVMPLDAPQPEQDGATGGNIQVASTPDGKRVVLLIDDKPLYLTLQGAWNLASGLRMTVNRLGGNIDRRKHNKK